MGVLFVAGSNRVHSVTETGDSDDDEPDRENPDKLSEVLGQLRCHNSTGGSSNYE